MLRHGHDIDTINKYAAEVAANVMAFFAEGNDVEVTVKEIPKPHGVETAVCLKDGMFEAVFYISAAFEEGIDPFDKAVHIVASFADNAAIASEVGDTDLSSWEEMRPKLRARVIGAERATEYLEGKISRVVAGLAIVPYLDDICEEGVIAVTEKMLSHWPVTAEAVVDIALRNSAGHDPAALFDMGEFMFGEGEDLFQDERELSVEKPYLLLSRGGAAALFYDGIMEKVHERLGDYYIIPSSIHELIMLSTLKTNASTLRSMVREANATVVLKEDKLSDDLFIYRCGTLSVA